MTELDLSTVESDDPTTAWQAPDATATFTLTPTEAVKGIGDEYFEKGTSSKTYDEDTDVYSPVKTSLKPKVVVNSDKLVVCFDTETTGVDPWDFRLLVCSFWDVSKPKNTMVTFAGWDEESLIHEIADYINELAPDILTAYNAAFDVRALTTRAMAFQVPIPALFNARYHDTMEYMKRGTDDTMSTNNKSGSLEDWSEYLWNEPKPYDIDTCFAAVDAGDLTPFIIRNRWDVATEGDLWNLLQYIKGAERSDINSMKPTAYMRDEAMNRRVAATQCTNCLTIQDYDMNGGDQECYICGSILPRPTSALPILDLHPELAVEYDENGNIIEPSV